MENVINTGANGIIIEGKVYELVRSKYGGCHKCAIYELCSEKLARFGSQPCLIFDRTSRSHLILSKELTDRLNNLLHSSNKSEPDGKV